MARVVLKMNLSENSGKITGLSDNYFNKNNVSSLQHIIKNKSSGANMLVVGSTISDIPYNSISKYDGICGSLTNSQGILPTNLKLTICTGFSEGKHLTNATIYFDKTAKQWATECVIDGKTYYNDDYIWAITFENPDYSKDITFTKWSRPNYCACVTYVATELNDIEINNHNIKEINTIKQIQPTQDAPFYGVMTSDGEFNIGDGNGEFLDYIKDGIFKPQQPIKILINDIEYDTQIISDWNEPNQSQMTLSANLTDISTKLDERFNGIPLFAYTTALSLLNEVLEQTNIDYQIDNNAEFELSQIQIYNCYLNKSTYKEAINKICEIAQICAYVDNNKLIFTTSTPRTSSFIPTINITANAQVNDFKQTILPKNNYDGINVNVSKYSFMQNSLYSTPSEINEINSTIVDEMQNFESKEWSISGENANLRYKLSATVKFSSNAITIESEKEIFSDKTLLSLSSTIIAPISISKTKNINVAKGNQIFYFNVEDYVYYGADSVARDYFIEQMFNYFKYKIQQINPYKIRIYIYSIKEINFSRIIQRYKDNIWENDGTQELGIISLTNLSFNIKSSQISEETFVYKTPNSLNPLILNSQNELMQENTAIEISDEGDTQPIYEHISYNIKNWYTSKNGIRFASLTVNCGVDFYNSNGNIAVSWKNPIDGVPNTLKVGNKVKILNSHGISKSKYPNGEDILWKIIGIEFKHNFLPQWVLQLMEVY